MRYRSKVDWWVGAVLWIAALLPAVIAQFEQKLFPLAFSAFVLALYGIVLIPVSYETLPEALIIRAGMLRTRIEYSEIHSVCPSRDPLSSPALSLDRIEICYGQGARILISPKDKAGFMEDLRARIPTNASIT